MSPAVAILAVGTGVAASCALVGAFLVLRRSSLLGDAISHAVLPGIVVAFLWTGTRAAVPMLVGAGAVGVLTVFLVERLERSGRLREDASIGVVFPALFAVGVVLVGRYAADVHIDLDCVLYGEIAYVPWDVWIVDGTSFGPRALWIVGAVLLFDLAFVALFYKELELSSFDPGMADAVGFSTRLVHYALMTAVSVTVVAAFESVGAILVVAMLIVPPCAALLLTHRLAALLGLAVGIGVASVFIGYAFARELDVSIAGSIAVAAGLLFLASWVGSPYRGVLVAWLRRRRLTLRLASDLLLMHLDRSGGPVSIDSVRRALGWSERKMATVSRSSIEAGWVVAEPGALRLTRSGIEAVDRDLSAIVGHARRDPAG